MEELSRENYTNMLFGWNQYQPFIWDGKADFTDPLFLRYLAFLQTLPETGQTYMTHATNNYDALFAGEVWPRPSQSKRKAAILVVRSLRRNVR